MKDVQLEIQGKKLFFGRSGTLDYIKEAINEDALLWVSSRHERMTKREDGIWSLSILTDEVIPIAYSGINLQKDLDDEDNVPLEKVTKWLHLLSFEEKVMIVNALTTCMAVEPLLNENGQELGEQKTQPVS